MKVAVKGVERLLPYHKCGYDSNGGKIHDPNSTMQKLKRERDALAQAKARPPPLHQKGFGKGAQGLSAVKETFYPSILENKICVLDGSNLRTLRDGLGLCSPGIITPGGRQSKPFWKVAKNDPLRAECGNSEGDLIAP